MLIPTDWGMFTRPGNRAITKRVHTLIIKLETKCMTFEKKRSAFRTFFKGFTKMEDSKNYGEAGDTDVRDQVWSYAVQLGNKHHVSYDTLDELWEHRYDR